MARLYQLVACGQLEPDRATGSVHAARNSLLNARREVRSTAARHRSSAAPPKEPKERPWMVNPVLLSALRRLVIFGRGSGACFCPHIDYESYYKIRKRLC